MPVTATRIVGYAVVFAIAAAWFVFLRPTTLGGSATYVIVSGHSMEPTYFTGDLAIVRKKREYRKGDVVAFFVPEVENGRVIHRVVGGSAEEGYVVQGDNRPTKDPWRPKPDTILGSPLVSVPKVGGLLGRLRDPRSLALVVGGLALIMTLGSAAFERAKGGASPGPRRAPAAPALAGLNGPVYDYRSRRRYL